MSGLLPAVFEPVPFGDHALLDSGDGRKLERFGARVLDRPDPQALWSRRLEPEEWARADLAFERESDRGGRWVDRRGRRADAGAWEVGHRDARFVLRPTPFKHVGLFPEQAATWEWLRRVGPRLGDGPRLLNLFGYTGAASVLCAQAGWRVTHVDASRQTLGWLRENLRASGLGEESVRVLLEDALAFAEREARRGEGYDAILVDPPRHGRGPKGERWQLEEGLAPLLEACGGLLGRRGALALSVYAVGWSPQTLANLVAPRAEAGPAPGAFEAGELALREEPRAELPMRLLPCGFCARVARGLEEGA